MADEDEDVISHPRILVGDGDLTDETQDFRFLHSVSREDAAIPKRGEKDFEPHATMLQSDTLAASRQAMHNALSFERIHVSKGHNSAVYHPESNMAYVTNPKGPHFAKMGSTMSAKEDPLGNAGLRAQRLWLLPEETLYLLERGGLDVRWPNSDGDETIAGLPMSLQGAYAMFIGDEEFDFRALTLERYLVYAGLKRSGYTVLRAPSWDGPGPMLRRDSFAPLPQRTWHIGLSALTSWWSTLFAIDPEKDDAKQTEGPLVEAGLFRGYAEIYRRLQLISFHDPITQAPVIPPDPLDIDLPFRIAYHVWKPGSQTFKKSAPVDPDFRIAVVNARETSIPTLEQLSGLLDTTPYNPPSEHAQLYQKLKHGYKSVVLAIVDQGVVSYLRIADAAFGREKLYMRKGKAPGGKRGGKGGGRGRGR